MKTTLLAAAFLLPVLAGAEPAWALDSVNLCFQYDTEYEDNGEGGEDYWLSDIERGSRGQRVTITDGLGGPTLFDSYLGDAIGAGDPGGGCTGEMLVSSAPGDYWYLFYSYGHVNGNYVRGFNSTGSVRSVLGYYTISSGSGGTYTVTVDTSSYFDEFNVYAAGALAVQRHGGGLSGDSFNFYVGTATTGYDSANDDINISTGSSNEKFKIIHEAGHAMADFTTGGAYVGSDYSRYLVACPSEPGTDNSTANRHSMRSREYSGAATNEGFAHFFSAITWNDDSTQNADCWFEYYAEVDGDQDPAVNCDNDTDNAASFEIAFMENVCGASAGRGVELDWIRTFWNVRTMGASNRPSFTTIVDWMDTADPPGNSDVYQVLDDEANDISGGTSQQQQLNTNWDSTKVSNGVDH